MRWLYRIGLCFGVLLLPVEAAELGAASRPSEEVLAGPARPPAPLILPAPPASGDAAAPETRSTDLGRSQPALAAAAPDRLEPTSFQRPEEFWWASPAEVLDALYGACGARDCCKYCVRGKACGDTCIERTDNCHVGCGCACQKPLFFGEQ